MDFLTNPQILLSLIVFLPAAGALMLAFFPKGRDELMRVFSLTITLAVFLLTVWVAIPGHEPNAGRFLVGEAAMQQTFSLPWIPAFHIHYFLGLDGISFPLVILTSFLSVLAMGASWPIAKYVRAYCILFLLLETGMLGVFMALDFFLFYVFWEVMLLPMYFLIGIWGGPRREYAAIKFFLFTLVGGVLMLVALLMLYFASDLHKLTPEQLTRSKADVQLAAEGPQAVPGAQARTFNILALGEIGRLPESPFNDAKHPLLWGQTLGWWAFLLLFIGFVIKLPAVPVHTWLPDAHVEAPTPISMILAGVLLKMGGYGVLRICYPLFPAAAYDLAWMVSGIGVVSMVYGAFAALAQKDFKRLVAYSSVSHMGYVLLGIGAWAAVSPKFVPDYWQMGMNGAMFQMIAHGISSAGMFFLVGVVYERVHHRNLDEFGGLFGRMPLYGGLSIGIFFAAMGLPGLCGFWGEVWVVIASSQYNMALAIVSASVVILTAAYILWTVQRVYLGPEYKGPHGDHLTPMTAREVSIAVPLLAFAILFGMFPSTILSYMSPSVNRTVEQLTQWSAADHARAAEANKAHAANMPALPMTQTAANGAR